MRHHRVRSSTAKPTLEVLPIDPKTARKSELASIFGGMQTSEDVKEQSKQLRVLLETGPVTQWIVRQTLKVPKARAQWLLRKFVLEHLIEKVDGMWRLKSRAVSA